MNDAVDEKECVVEETAVYEWIHMCRAHVIEKQYN